MDPVEQNIRWILKDVATVYQDEPSCTDGQVVSYPVHVIFRGNRHQGVSHSGALQHSHPLCTHALPQQLVCASKTCVDFCK